MSDNPIVKETRRKLNELEQRIDAARSSLGADKEIAQEARKDWDEMVRAHAAIRRRLEADQSSDVLEGVRLDIDVLRNSFERWMARVESGFARGGKKRG